ncbi:MAG: hypothetical protein HKN76_14880 [Saprospiraceae bacterium]|nr:hypothetical protein [Saprospiraceae bacterium]
MRSILILPALCLTATLLSQNLEVEGKVKISEMETDNTADSLMVWRKDGYLGIRDAATMNQKLIDLDNDTRIQVEKAADDDVIRFITRDSQIMIIDSSGHIGIGDTLPSEALTLHAGSFLQTPTNPRLSGSLGIGEAPVSVYVSGRYAYVADPDSDDLRVVDVSNPSAPVQVGSLGIGTFPFAVFVSGRYAYVIDQGSADLKVIDVSNPSGPSLTGSLALGVQARSVYVSGRYVYVVDSGSDDLKVIDVSSPSSPSLTGSLAIGSFPKSVYVSGIYAYVADEGSNDLRIIDVSDPSAPSLTGTLGIGDLPQSVYVSGRYAYIVDVAADDLKVIDVSNPSLPALAGSLTIGGSPRSVYVSGRYAYVVDVSSDDLKVIDVSNPGTPLLAGSLTIGSDARSVFVSGRQAYVVDALVNDIKVIDVSGAEVTALNAHSLEAGNLQVKNDIIAQGQIQVMGGLNVGAGGIFSDGNLGISGSLALANDMAPTSSPANLVQLYAEDAAGSSELIVRDEAGNVTTLSPHNFSLIGDPSEPLAWSFYSQNEHGKINVDMLKTVRLVEELSGEQLVYIQGHHQGEKQPVVQNWKIKGLLQNLQNQGQELQAENRAMKSELEMLKIEILELKTLLRSKIEGIDED